MTDGSIDAYGDGILNDGSSGYVKITDGTVYSETQCAIWNKSNYGPSFASTGSSVYITGGTFISNCPDIQGRQATTISNSGEGFIYITGGTVEARGGCRPFAINSTGSTQVNSAVNIINKSGEACPCAWATRNGSVSATGTYNRSLV